MNNIISYSKLLSAKFPFLLNRNNIYNYGIFLLTTIVNLMMLPLLLSSLGKEKFGVWQTILSFMAYVSLLNFGMGNGLRNTVSKYFVHKNFEAIGNLIGQTIKKLATIIIVFLILLLPLGYIFFDSEIIFKNASSITQEINITILIFLFFFLTNMIFALSSSVAFGLNKSYLPGFVNLLYLVSVYTIVYYIDKCSQINLPLIAIFFGAIQTISNLLFLFFLINKFQIKLTFEKKYNLNPTIKLSLHFFIVQALSIIFLTSDNIIISKLLGPQETADYAIISKMYFTIISLFSVLLISFWNRVTIAYEKKDFVWIKRNLRNLMITSSAVFISGLILAYIYPSIIEIMFGRKNSLQLEPLTFYLFSCFTFLYCFNAAIINFQNGIGDIKTQIISTGIMILLLIGGSIVLNVDKYGYNLILIVKTIALIIGIIINLFSLKKIS